MAGSRRSGSRAIVPAVAVDDVRVSPAMLRVLVALASHADSAGACFPKVETLAARLGMWRQNVSTHLQQLERLGYVSIMRRRGAETGRQIASLYTIHGDVDVPAAFCRSGSPQSAPPAHHHADTARASSGRHLEHDHADADRALPRRHSAHGGADTRKEPTEQTNSRTNQRNDTTPRPPPSEGERRQRRRRGNGADVHDDVAAPAETVAPATDADVAVWDRARIAAGQDMSPGNAAQLDELVPIGRGPDGGLLLRARPGQMLGRFRSVVARALLDAGDQAGARVAIVDGPTT